MVCARNVAPVVSHLQINLFKTDHFDELQKSRSVELISLKFQLLRERPILEKSPDKQVHRPPTQLQLRDELRIISHCWWACVEVGRAAPVCQASTKDRQGSSLNSSGGNRAHIGMIGLDRQRLQERVHVEHVQLVGNTSDSASSKPTDIMRQQKCLSVETFSVMSSFHDARRFFKREKKSITATSRSNFLLALTEATVDRGGSRAGIELARSEWLRLRGEQATSNQ